MTLDPELNALSPTDAEICLRTAMMIEHRKSLAKEDQLIVVALRYLAAKILGQSR